MFNEKIKENEKYYKFHKGDKVSVYISGKKYHGTIIGYIFYGADKFCQSPAYIIKYKTSKQGLTTKKITIYDEEKIEKEVE